MKLKTLRSQNYNSEIEKIRNYIFVVTMDYIYIVFYSFKYVFFKFSGYNFMYVLKKFKVETNINNFVVFSVYKVYYIFIKNDALSIQSIT